MGEYQNSKHQQVFKNIGPLTDVTIPTRLNAQEQRELQGRMEKKQMKEFMTVSLTLLSARHSCTPRHSFEQLLS